MPFQVNQNRAVTASFSDSPIVDSKHAWQLTVTLWKTPHNAQEGAAARRHDQFAG
jgi:hypothetical protein